MGGVSGGSAKSPGLSYFFLKPSLIVAIVTISRVLLLAVFPLLTVVAVKALRAVLDLKVVVTALALMPK